MHRYDLRPRALGELLDAAVRSYGAGVVPLVLLTACVTVPLQLAWAIIELVTLHHGSQVTGGLFGLHLGVGHGHARGPHVPAGIEVLQFVVPTLIALLSTAACVRALADVAAGARPSVGGSLVAALTRLPALVGLYVVRSVLTGIGFLLFIIPGIWLAGAWSVSVPALMLEGTGPWGALERSRTLVRGRWWPVIGVLIVTDITVAVASGLIQALFGAVDGFAAHPALVPAVIASALGASVAAVLVQPFNAAVRVALYLDLRVRGGEAEVDDLAAQLGVEA